MSAALPLGTFWFAAEDIRPKLITSDYAANGVFDGPAAISGDLAATAPARDGRRPDAQNIGKPILSSEEVDGFFERGDGHGCEFSHELTTHVKPSANYMTLATG